ncbi:MAG TPA: efflux RND transporter periplasmic adaptor subunit [Caulobacteraceae bacterium]|jgi:multidrug efflux system membrane fusion protein|nr:efflux RND transporter periplasmic adaptor subunit [Caulobacteraceae bacterium]
MAAAPRRRWVFIALGVLAVALFAWAVLHPKKKPPQHAPVVSVAVAQVAAQDVPVSIEALGAAQAWRSDTIVAQVSGVLKQVNFQEGSHVRAGQLLAVVDPAPYQAALTQTEGQLHRDQAILAGARRNLARYATLAAQDSIARQTYEDQQAVVSQDEGVVQLDEGALQGARVNLGRTRITSPISGRAGVRLVDPGNVVGSGAASASTNGSGASLSTNSGATPGAASSSAGSSGSVTGGVTGSSGIVVINQVQPIAVTFTVPQSDFQNLLQVSDGFRRPLVTRAYTQESAELIGEGELSIADNKVDPGTGTIELKARFDNPGERLWPGQYVTVRLTLDTLRQVPTVPASAIQHGARGDYVFVVSGGKALQRQVVVRTTQNELAVIASGLRLGETVVTDGQLALRNGAQVRLPGQRAPAAPASHGNKAAGAGEG